MRKYMRRVAIRSHAVARLKSRRIMENEIGIALEYKQPIDIVCPSLICRVNTIVDICSKRSTAEVSSGQLKMSEADLILRSMNTHQVLVIVVDTRFLGYSTDSLQKHYLASIGTSESVRLPGCESEYIFLGDHMDRCRSSWSLW